MNIPIGYWLAPWEATAAMTRARQMNLQETPWVAMRDAYLAAHPEHGPGQEDEDD